ncbi:cell wall hydrolase [Sphingomonas ginsenosidivorax]|uniref:Cell wall hydrolase n=1 Tax=Sphingomonas ginsenosidivorax TaxID=862135 RepID=A0A5C6UEL1_9SPHN|nr:cell wall hydrolase [Sphingomonas ginsenosidivorax]TXC71139.1 cell wall hydrolase [Sphingomonas ginsenosidivorax]
MTILRAGLAGIAALAIAGPLLVIANPPSIAPPPKVVVPRARVVPKAELPPVEPVRFVALAPQDARAFNATVPFSTDPNPAARPFTFAGAPDDLARATDCLAAAVLYEAGDDAVGEQAVAQVVLNRLRHPAFPKTVCGVVFEGSDRTTGCQFTFACDGALVRRPSEPGWKRAREIATAALAGSVYKPVGYATHYHTDWVVPYWQSSLDKVAAVHTHLFFRWTGWWGTPAAFNRHVLSGEPAIAKLAGLSDAHGMGTALAVSADGEAMIAGLTLNARGLAPLPSDPNSFLTSLDPRQADGFAALALRACGDRPRCKVMGWTDPGDMGFRLPLTDEQIAALSFSYLRDRAAGYERTLWNCTEFKPVAGRQCMKRQLMRATAAQPLPPSLPDADEAPAPPVAELEGVRRKPPQATPGAAPAAAVSTGS